ncbi:MAG: class I SAM-dependent methyltransferase, partial [Rhodospirillales bacterium]|nr:class I SAM-dependent methyltransferase [Rhodospirillales bacterium]
MESEPKLAAGSGGSVVVEACQACGDADLQSVLFLGYLPPVNQMRMIGARPHEQPAYPAELLYCPRCEMVQIGLIVDPAILFPPDYPYTSGTTRILHENFADLSRECAELLAPAADDLIVDIGSNDGTLLSKFADGGWRLLGIEPTEAGQLARDKGIATEAAFFTKGLAERMKDKHGAAKLVTAANCFAHIENVHDIIKGVVALLADDGVFVSESHYLISLLETVQYDTVYHEHLRYYSLTSLVNLFAMHDLEVIHARPIPSHGGSIRVYAARQGSRPALPSVKKMLAAEAARGPMAEQLSLFKDQVVASKTELLTMLHGIKAEGQRIQAISAPSRASTLAHYAGLDDGLIDCILEIDGSRKIGRTLPGTLIPVVEESRLFADQPEYA